MNGNEALERLKRGNRRFVEQNHEVKTLTDADRQGLIKGQQPYAVVVCCSDSRVAPEIIFDAGFNELFVVRNAGNIVTASELASVEYALTELHVPLVVVMGHEKCGAVSEVCNLLEKGETSVEGNLKALVDQILPSAKKTQKGDNKKTLTEYENARHSMSVITEEPAVKELIANKELIIATAHFKISTGEVEFFE